VIYIEYFPYCLFVSNSQVIGCEDCLRNDLYCVGWGVKLCSIQYVFLLRASLFVLWFLCVLVYFLLFVLSCQYQCKWLPGKTRHRNCLLWVKHEVKIYSVSHFAITFLRCRKCCCQNALKMPKIIKLSRVVEFDAVPQWMLWSLVYIKQLYVVL